MLLADWNIMGDFDLINGLQDGQTLADCGNTQRLETVDIDITQCVPLNVVFWVV